MAISVSHLVTTGSGITQTSYSVNSVSMVADTWNLVVMVCDNAAPLGVASVRDAINDTQGNEYTLLTRVNRTSGSANDGVTLSAWICKVKNTASTNITFTFTDATITKLATVYRISAAVDKRILVDRIGAGASGFSNQYSINADSVEQGYALFGLLGAESGSFTGFQDSDSVNGSWSIANSGSVGFGGESSVFISSQYKITTATGNQTFNGDLATNKDFAVNWITLYEADLPPALLGYWGLNQVTEIVS